MRTAQLAILVNTGLAIAKLVAGLVGNTYALVADAIESTTDILGSTIVWGGLRVAARDPDEKYPFGYGKAEPLAAAVVALMILGAAVAVALAAIGEIRSPQMTPAPWTLIVLVAVVAIKWVLSRRVQAVAADTGSTAVRADAWHHMSDAITSAAAFVGISISVWGGPGLESADDWAALLAAAIIAYNGVAILRPALDDLMDRTPDVNVVESVRRAAEGVEGVLATEKIAVRRSGMGFRATLHVQASPTMTLDAAHVMSGKVKSAIKEQVPRVAYVLVHMEPFEGSGQERG